MVGIAGAVVASMLSTQTDQHCAAVAYFRSGLAIEVTWSPVIIGRGGAHRRGALWTTEDPAAVVSEFQAGDGGMYAATSSCWIKLQSWL